MELFRCMKQKPLQSISLGGLVPVAFLSDVSWLYMCLHFFCYISPHFSILCLFLTSHYSQVSSTSPFHVLFGLPVFLLPPGYQHQQPSWYDQKYFKFSIITYFIHKGIFLAPRDCDTFLLNVFYLIQSYFYVYWKIFLKNKFRRTHRGLALSTPQISEVCKVSREY